MRMRRLRSRAVLAAATVLAAVACFLAPSALWGQASTGPWRVVPQVGLAFHGGYYDDQVVTIFPNGERDDDIAFLGINPGPAVRVGAAVEYALTSGVWLFGGLAGNWPEADIEVNGILRSEVDMSVVEVNGGALFRLGEWGGGAVGAGGARVFPFYVGGDLSLVWHSFDGLLRPDRFVDVTTTSLGISGKFGVDYPVGPRIAIRGEGRWLLIRGGFGNLEDELAAAAALDEGEPLARTELEGSSFSSFLLNGAVVIRF